MNRKAASSMPWAIVAGTALIAIAAVIIVLLVRPESTTDQNVITVTGTAEGEFQPDQVEIWFAVATNASDAAKAQQENTRRTNQTIDALNRIGIITTETQGYNIYPEYDWASGRQQIKGYRVEQSFKATITDFSMTGDALVAVVSAGTNIVSNVQFSLSKNREEQLRAELLGKAAENARAKAESLATSLGARLGKAVQINMQDYYFPPVYYARGMVKTMSAALEVAASPPVPPAQQTSTATVSVAFELK